MLLLLTNQPSVSGAWPSTQEVPEKMGQMDGWMSPMPSCGSRQTTVSLFWAFLVQL